MASLTWTDNELFRPLQVWGEDNTQVELKGSKRNKHVYDKISDELHVYGISLKLESKFVQKSKS